MALTDTQKAQARRWLGVPDVSRQYDLRLESSLNALSTEGEEQVCSILEELEGIRAQLKTARECRLKVLQVEDVRMAHELEIKTLWKEGNRLALDLGVALYFTPRRMPFGTGTASWSYEGVGVNIAGRG